VQIAKRPLLGYATRIKVLVRDTSAYREADREIDRDYIEAKAKEIRKVAEGLIALAVKEKDNFETVTVTAKVARKDADGKRVKEVVDGKKVTVYDEVQKEITKDAPSRLHARRQMAKVFYSVKEVPAKGAGKKNTGSWYLCWYANVGGFQ